MKFLFITNNDHDGAGQQVVRLSNYLLRKNHKVTILVANKKKKLSNIFEVKRVFIYRILNFIFKFLVKKKFTLFNFDINTANFRDIKKHTNNADVIFFYSTFNLISTRILSQLLKLKKKFFLRPCDMEMLTGGCHMNFNCNKYKKNCNICPQVIFSKIFNFSKKNIEKKSEIYLKYSPRIIFDSSFLENITRNNSIVSNLKKKVIHFGVETLRYRNINKFVARKKLNLDPHKKIILYGAFNLDDPRKGYGVLLGVFKKISTVLSNNKTNQKIILLTMGKTNNFYFNFPNIEWKHLGLINSEMKLNLIYRASDILFCPSIDDTGPHIVREAVMNDLQVISFDRGAAIDLVLNGINGFRVKCFDINEFTRLTLKLIMQNNKNLFKKIEFIKKELTTAYEANQIIDFIRKY